MTNFRQLMSALEAHYPPQMAESWDQVGNHFGRPEAPVKRLMAVLDLDDASLAEAIEKGVDTLIVHHPVLFSPIRRFDFSSPEQAGLLERPGLRMSRLLGLAVLLASHSCHYGQCQS